MSRHEGTTFYHTTMQKPAGPPSAIRSREADWNALSLNDRMAVLAWHREEEPTLSDAARTFVRRHYDKEQQNER